MRNKLVEINWIRMLLLFPGVPLNLASISSDFQLDLCEVRGSEKEEERERESWKSVPKLFRYLLGCLTGYEMSDLYREQEAIPDS